MQYEEILVEKNLLNKLKEVCPDGKCCSENCKTAIMESLKKLGYSDLF